MTATNPDSTKLTARIYGPAFERLNKCLIEAHIKRDAFLDRVIAQEIPHLREDLKGLRLSDEARRYIAQEHGRLGARDTRLKQVSIALRPKTADELNSAVEAHNLVRDAFLSRLVVLLAPLPQTLKKLGFADRVSSSSELGAADAATSPLESILETMADPFHYFRSQLKKEKECGLYLLNFSVLHVGFSCYMHDREVPGTEAFEAQRLANEAQEPLDKFF